MFDFEALLPEIFALIIEKVVLIVGIQRAVLLRTVNHAFNAEIEHAICDSQVIDFEDPDVFMEMRRCMPAMLRGKIIERKSRSANLDHEHYLSVVFRINRFLDSMITETDPATTQSRRELIAAAICFEVFPADDLEHADFDAQNYLCGAAIAGNLAVIQLLLDQSDSTTPTADVNSETPYFDKPLCLAASRGHYHVVEYLLAHGACHEALADHHPDSPHPLQLSDWTNPRVNYQGCTLYRFPPSALRAATLGGHDALVHLLLSPAYRLPVNSLEYFRVVAAAACVGRLDLIDLFLHILGLPIWHFSHLNLELLHAATRFGHTELVRALLARDRAKFGTVPLLMAEDPVRRWSGKKKQPRFESVLQTATERGWLEIVRLLVVYGVDVHWADEWWDGRVIEEAACAGQAEVVELRVALSVDREAAFHAAVEEGRVRLVRDLLRECPDLPGGKNGEVGQKALSAAVKAGNLTFITMLYKAGVDLNARWSVGQRWSPWTAAPPIDTEKRCGYAWVVRHLLALGAHDTEKDMEPPVSRDMGGFRLTERTWEWRDRY